jgi:hypothetical protein
LQFLGVGPATGIAIADAIARWRRSPSPLYVDGHIYICSHEGTTTAIALGDAYQELAINELDGQIMASPVVADGDLLLRTDTHVYRIGEKGEKSSV